MPKSRRRRKTVYTEPAARQTSTKRYSPAWLVPTMLAFFLIGIVWLLVYYLSQAQYPVPSFGAWNQLVGFGFILVGFGLATQWR